MCRAFIPEPLHLLNVTVPSPGGTEYVAGGAAYSYTSCPPKRWPQYHSLGPSCSRYIYCNRYAMAPKRHHSAPQSPTRAVNQQLKSPCWLDNHSRFGPAPLQMKPVTRYGKHTKKPSITVTFAQVLYPESHHPLHELTTHWLSPKQPPTCNFNFNFNCSHRVTRHCPSRNGRHLRPSLTSQHNV